MHLKLFLDALKKLIKIIFKLNAERENIKVSEQEIKYFKSDYKPTLTLSGSKSH